MMLISEYGNIIFLFTPILVAVVMAVIAANCVIRPLETTILSWACYGLGFVMFLVAKFSVIRKGKMIGCGSGPMSKRMRYPYRAGYFFMIIGALITLGMTVLAGQS